MKQITRPDDGDTPESGLSASPLDLGALRKTKDNTVTPCQTCGMYVEDGWAWCGDCTPEVLR